MDRAWLKINGVVIESSVLSKIDRIQSRFAVGFFCIMIANLQQEILYTENLNTRAEMKYQLKRNACARTLRSYLHLWWVPTCDPLLFVLRNRQVSAISENRQPLFIIHPFLHVNQCFVALWIFPDRSSEHPETSNIEKRQLLLCSKRPASVRKNVLMMKDIVEVHP